MAGKKATKKTTKSEAASMAPEPKQTNKKAFYKNRKIVILVAVLILAGLAYLGRGLFVVATVNGAPITRLEVIRQLESQSGAQTLDQLITEILIKQEAKKQNIVITETEVNAEVEKLSQQMEDQGQDLDDILALQGISRKQLGKQFELQLIVQKLFADQVEVSQEDVDQYIKDLGENANGLSEEEIQAQARQQLEQQDLVTAFQSWLQEARTNANINYIVNY